MADVHPLFERRRGDRRQTVTASDVVRLRVAIDDVTLLITRSIRLTDRLFVAMAVLMLLLVLLTLMLLQRH